MLLLFYTMMVVYTHFGMDSQPLKLILALTTPPRVASLGLQPIHLLCVQTDEPPRVFVLCGFCRPGANARGKARENSKK